MSVDLPWVEVCGSNRGYQRHRYWGSVPCLACMDAHRDYERARRAAKAKPAPRELAPCGTPSAWRRHMRRGEMACEACLAAHRGEALHYVRKRRAA